MKIIERKEALEKKLKYYFTGRPCKRGHISIRSMNFGCIDCYEDKKAIRAEVMEIKRKEKSFPSLAREYGADYLLSKTMDDLYLEEIKSGDSIRVQKGVNGLIRNPLKSLEKSRAIISINALENKLGYSKSDLYERISSKFKDGMSWGNRELWHIDHIKPVNEFIKNGVYDPKIINALENLSPEWIEDNQRKGSIYKTERFDELQAKLIMNNKHIAAWLGVTERQVCRWRVENPQAPKNVIMLMQYRIKYGDL